MIKTFSVIQSYIIYYYKFGTNFQSILLLKRFDNFATFKKMVTNKMDRNRDE